jgi:hypothetical protein
VEARIDKQYFSALRTPELVTPAILRNRNRDVDLSKAIALRRTVL